MKIIRPFIYLLIVTIGCSIQVQAQQRNCGAMENLAIQLQKDPGLQERMNEIERHTSKYLSSHASENRATVYTIPVVVHVVYNTTAENVSMAQIQTQIQVLNDDFRRLNSDADGTWSQAADSEIEFCLATVDPSGNVTDGVTRTSTSVTSFGLNDEMKFNSSGGKDAWPAADYMNLWVGDITGGYLGYAQFPGGADATDGVVIDYAYFGTIGSATSPFDLGRTATHEVGHWLNLRHIWGDGPCGSDDFVSDTPTSDAANYGCATGHVSCSSTDMVQNYMDYSDDACMNLFTSGQKTRMRALFGSGGSKASLLNSGACGSGSTPTCTDGIQNGNETGVDCGGPDCPACPTCSDGVQNGNETGVDCGGPDCAPCSSGCADNDVNVSITFDNYPEETSWTITNAGGTVVASGGTYGSEPDGSTISIDLCLVDGCYDFNISDSYGDGICCSYGNGSYAVTSGANSLASGGSFTSSETTNFCFGTTAPTCTDGVQNGNETGIDCGGSDCPACPTCSDGVQNGSETGVDCGGPDCDPCNSGSTEVFGHFFESGWDGWQDGGSDCYRYNGSRSYEGSKSIRIRDNSGTSSAMTSSSYDVSGYSSLELEFYFYAYSMENGEDFFVRYYDGSAWSTVASYASGTNFNNNTFYTATVTINSANYNLASNAQFRFQCDASGNADHIYIDAVTLTGISGGAKQSNPSANNIVAIGNLNESVIGNSSNEMGVRLSPNPTHSDLNIEAEEEIVNIKIYTIDGKVIRNIDISNDFSHTLNVDELQSGLYFISLETVEDIYTEKFVKR